MTSIRISSIALLASLLADACCATASTAPATKADAYTKAVLDCHAA